MSVPSQPSHPPNQGSAPGDSPPRLPGHDSGPQPRTDPQDVVVPAEPTEEPSRNPDADPPRIPRLGQTPRGKRLTRPNDETAHKLTAEQRLLLLDTWRRSGLPAGDFAALVGLSKYTLYAWKHKFEAEGPAGLEDKPRGGPQGSRLPEITKRAILMMKQDNPDWGCEKISALRTDVSRCRHGDPRNRWRRLSIPPRLTRPFFRTLADYGALTSCPPPPARRASRSPGWPACNTRRPRSTASSP
jgi:hypothetical protein